MHLFLISVHISFCHIYELDESFMCLPLVFKSRERNIINSPNKIYLILDYHIMILVPNHNLIFQTWNVTEHDIPTCYIIPTVFKPICYCAFNSLGHIFQLCSDHQVSSLPQPKPHIPPTY